MRIRLESIGCRLNIGEIEAIARELAAAGHHIVGPGEAVDLCVFNSCSVTAIAARKSRHAIRQLKRANPDGALAVTGCLAELEPNAIHSLGVDLVVGNGDKDRLPLLLEEQGFLVAPDGPSEDESQLLGGAVGRTRAFLKVQDGCDNRCTFCVVTLARGAGRSRSLDEVVDEVRRLQRLGYIEVVLSGVHLGSFGHDLGLQRGLEALIRRILDDTDLPRLRLSSLEPWDLDIDFFSLFENPRLLPHVHLPLQSGCDDTLRRMARRGDRASFARLVEAARRADPSIAVSTDVMIGFPGESEREFSESIGFVEEMEFSRLHVFRYSRRDGTRAADLPDQVPAEEMQQRSRRMHTLGADLERRFGRRFVGRRVPVLWEQAEDLGNWRRWSGLTDNYIRTATETPDHVELSNRVTETDILSTVPGGVLGAIDGVSASKLIELEPRRVSSR